MPKQMLLSKANLINGIYQVQEVYFEDIIWYTEDGKEETGGSLKLRPLSDGEYHKINAKKTGAGLDKIETNPIMNGKKIDKAATMNQVKMRIDVNENDEKSYEADCEAVAMSLNNPENEGTFTRADVEQLRPVGIVKKIAKKVYELSGVPDDPEDFPEDDQTGDKE